MFDRLGPRTRIVLIKYHNNSYSQPMCDIKRTSNYIDVSQKIN